MIKNADLKEMKELLEKDIRLQYIAVRTDESRRYTVEICHFPAAPYVFGLCVQLRAILTTVLIFRQRR